MQPAFRLLQAVLEGSRLAQECLVPHALPETLACLETAGSHLQTPFLLEMFAKLITYLPGTPLIGVFHLFFYYIIMQRIIVFSKNYYKFHEPRNSDWSVK